MAAKKDEKETLHVVVNTESDLTRVTILYGLKK
jgi:hypothetical protein